MQENELIQTHLDRVSRSFAFCIRQLPDPLRLWVGVSYLLCRIVDTIEDSSFSTKERQQEAFSWFDQCLFQERSAVYPKDLWPETLSEGEALLLEDSKAVFEIFWAMDSGARERVSRLALSMSRGMRHFSTRSQGGSLKLKDLKEVNQYCFFVAGLVGEMLLGFISQLEPGFSFDVSRVVKAHHFGLFLQKVNLLKDQLKDQKLGRFLVPSRSEVAGSAKENAFEAFHFLEELPLRQIEFRRFCAWSLFMGLGSMQAREGKLSRKQTEKILLEVEESLQDNSNLKLLFLRAAESLGWMKNPLSKPQMTQIPVPTWLEKLYQGDLGRQHLGALGIS